MKIETGEWSEDQKDIELQESERLRIFHGEPMDILPLLKSGSVDAVTVHVKPISSEIYDEMHRLLRDQPNVLTGIYVDLSMDDGETAIQMLQESKRYIGIEPDDEKWKAACDRIRKYAKPKTVETKGGTSFVQLFGPPKIP